MNLMERAAKVLPGGVSSPVRAFKGVGGDPVFMRAGEGPYLVGEDGRRYVDYIGSYGPLIFGHRPPEVVDAIAEALSRGTTFGVSAFITDANGDLLRVLVAFALRHFAVYP